MVPKSYLGTKQASFTNRSGMCFLSYVQSRESPQSKQGRGANTVDGERVRKKGTNWATERRLG